MGFCGSSHISYYIWDQFFWECIRLLLGRQGRGRPHKLEKPAEASAGMQWFHAIHIPLVKQEK